MGVRFIGIILAIAALCAATAASRRSKQEQPLSALNGHNTNAPVDVTAERIEVQDRADRAVFSGNVHVTQADLTLDTARLTVAYSGGRAATCRSTGLMPLEESSSTARRKRRRATSEFTISTASSSR